MRDKGDNISDRQTESQNYVWHLVTSSQVRLEECRQGGWGLLRYRLITRKLFTCNGVTHVTSPVYLYQTFLFPDMFSTKSKSPVRTSAATYTHVSRGSGQMTRSQQPEAACPACCLSPSKFFRISAHVMKLTEVGLGGVCWYLLWVFGKE